MFGLSQFVALYFALAHAKRSRSRSNIQVKGQYPMFGAETSILGTQLAECNREQLPKYEVKDGYNQLEELVCLSVIGGGGGVCR